MELDLKNLRMTEEEEQLFDWCRANLEDEQIVDVEEEAFGIAMREINAPEAAEKLLELLVKDIVRNAEEQRYGSKQ